MSKKKKRLSLAEALEMVDVQPLDAYHLEMNGVSSLMSTHLLNGMFKGWFTVSTDERGGVIAYFGEEEDALRFRLAEVNRLLNG